MNTANNNLIKQARESLKDKWGLAIGTFAVYMLITGVLGSIHGIGPIASVLLMGPFMLGAAIFSLSVSRNQSPRLEQIFDGFKHYSKALSAYVLMVLIVVLWSLLLIIPGIVAALSYAMTFYILAEDTFMEPMAALEKSKKMMMGYKWKLFYLGLKFFLFSLLCILTLGIGFLWLVPLVHVTMAKFYDDIKENVASI